MRKNKRQNKILLLTVILLGVTIGFAALATTLKINGFTNVLKPNWNVYWANPVVSEGSVSTTLPVIGEDQGESENTKATWSATLALPGDYYEFTIDAVNTGSVDAMITNIESIVYDTNNNPISLPDYVVYTVTYDDGTEVTLNQLLDANSSKKYKVRVYYDYSKMTADDVNNIPASGLSYEFSYKVTYSVATDEVYRPTFREGEYFYMCPDKAIATTSYAGFSGSTPTADQCLWRVIKVNADGSADAVSHYVSTNDITITGSDGYRNLVAGLNDLASCYAKRGYTVKTRHMGYDGQAEIIKDSYVFNGATNVSPSEVATSTPTTGEGQEYEGGSLGDTLYLKDYLSVKNVYSNLNASTNGKTSKDYWLASRYYGVGGGFGFTGRYIDNAGSLTSDYRYYGQYGNNKYGIRRCCWANNSYLHSIRPIITVRSGLSKISGQGSLDDPYYISNKSGWVLVNNKEPMEDQKFEYWENGSKIMSGWHDLTDFSGRPNTYYFEDGYSYHGWLELDGKKYYLSTFDDDGNGYLDGRRFNSETREIDGVSYTFDENGVCTNCS